MRSELYIVELLSPPSPTAQIREETAQDTQLAPLREAIMNGWPESRTECPSQLHGYWNYRDELTIEDGIILKGRRMIIPHKLRPAVLGQLHYAHQGGEKCKLRAKGSVFWDGINKDIDNMVAACALVSPINLSNRKNHSNLTTFHHVLGILSQVTCSTGTSTITLFYLTCTASFP